jgi:hypothetical protein
MIVQVKRKILSKPIRNGNALILDQCNGSVYVDEKYIFMRNEQKSSYVVRQIDHVLKQVEQLKKETNTICTRLKRVLRIEK